jgi:hypothetical protein
MFIEALISRQDAARAQTIRRDAAAFDTICQLAPPAAE